MKYIVNSDVSKYLPIETGLLVGRFTQRMVRDMRSLFPAKFSITGSPNCIIIVIKKNSFWPLPSKTKIFPK